MGEGRRCDARAAESRGNRSPLPARFGTGHLEAVQERQHQAQQGHRTAESVQIIFAMSVSAVETDCIVVSGLSCGASCGMDLLGDDVGVPPERGEYHHGLSCILLLLRVELRCG